MSQPLVLGTRNRKKLAELVELLAPHGIEVHSLDEFPQAIDVDEDGETFLSNAEKKARQQAIHLGRWVLGEDSGLVVEALGGRPGVLSARYAAGPGAGNSSDQANNAKLLAELRGVPPERRRAYYVCTAALADPRGAIAATAEGRCYGRIRHEPAGQGGFGYDPLFEVLEYHRTYGELGPEVKSCLSHRGRAMRSMLPDLVRRLSPGLGAQSQWPTIPADLRRPQRSARRKRPRSPTLRGRFGRESSPGSCTGWRWSPHWPSATFSSCPRASTRFPTNRRRFPSWRDRWR